MGIKKIGKVGCSSLFDGDKALQGMNGEQVRNEGSRTLLSRMLVQSKRIGHLSLIVTLVVPVQ